MAEFNFKTATPVTTGVDANFFWFGAASQAAATPSIYSMGAMTTFLSTASIAGFSNLAGHVIWTTDNTYDIGANGVNRPRRLFLSDSVIIGVGSSVSSNSTGVLTFASDGVIRLLNAASNGFDRLQFGGATTSFPAIGRTTTYLTNTLADGTLANLLDSEVFATTQVVTSLSNSSTSAQNVFAAANDVLTLRAATTYFFEALYFINTGATSHTTATSFAASSAFTNIAYLAELWSTTAGTISTTAPSILDVTASTATVLNAASTATRTTIRCRGIIRTNASTTVTPQITFSAGPTGTCEIAVNSYFRAWPVGSNTIAAFGDWA